MPALNVSNFETSKTTWKEIRVVPTGYLTGDGSGSLISQSVLLLNDVPKATRVIPGGKAFGVGDGMSVV
jgi:hypothetical protein